MAGCCGMGTHGASLGVQGAVEEHVFNPDVVVEPLQVPQVGYGGCGVDVQVRGAVPGDLQVMRGREGSDPQPFGDAPAAGHVGLQAVDCTASAHPAEVGQVIAVLTGGDIRRDGVPDLTQAIQIIRSDWFLEPPDIQLGSGPERFHSATSTAEIA